MAITRRLPGSFTASPVSALTTTVGAVRFAIVLALAASIAPVLLVGAVAEGGEALPYSYDDNEELAPTNDVANATSPLARATNGARRDTDLRHGLRLAADLVAPSGLADDFVDLASSSRRSHILDGEVRPNGTFGGGHRAGTGYPGKSEFTAGWSDDQIMHHISDVATDPLSTTVRTQGRDVFVAGTRDGIDIEVLIRNGEIWTGYPTNVPRSP